MAEIKFNFEQYDGQLSNACMDRLRAAAGEIQLQAILKCHVGRTSRPVYKRGKNAGQPWTAREIGALRRTIRVVEKKDKQTIRDMNVRVYAGNFLTWYAIQVEYGRGMWRGGAFPFMRPALSASKYRVQTIIESGGGQTMQAPGFWGGEGGRPVRTGSYITSTPSKPIKTKSGLPHLFDSPEWKAYVARGRKPK